MFRLNTAGELNPGLCGGEARRTELHERMLGAEMGLPLSRQKLVAQKRRRGRCIRRPDERLRQPHEQDPFLG